MFYWFVCFFLFFKQKTAYEMRISDWSSDVCSSDLIAALLAWSLRYVTVFADDILAARRELDRLEARRDRLVAADAGLPDADRRQRRRTRLKAYFGRRRREGRGAPIWGTAHNGKLRVDPDTGAVTPPINAHLLQIGRAHV